MSFGTVLARQQQGPGHIMANLCDAIEHQLRHWSTGFASRGMYKGRKKEESKSDAGGRDCHEASRLGSPDPSREEGALAPRPSEGVGRSLACLELCSSCRLDLTILCRLRTACSDNFTSRVGTQCGFWQDVMSELHPAGF